MGRPRPERRDTPLFIVAAEDPKPAHHSTDSVCAKKYSSVDENKEQKRKRKKEKALVGSSLNCNSDLNEKAL